jgi:hypothetical protein
VWYGSLSVYVEDWHGIVRHRMALTNFNDNTGCEREFVVRESAERSVRAGRSRVNEYRPGRRMDGWMD